MGEWERDRALAVAEDESMIEIISKILLKSPKSVDVAYCEGTVEEFIEAATQLEASTLSAQPKR